MAEPLTFGIQASLLAGGFASMVLALSLRRLGRAVAAFALGSGLLAAAFFVLASPFAAALELTVGAGLVAVLFLVAITLVGGGADRGEAPA